METTGFKLSLKPVVSIRTGCKTKVDLYNVLKPDFGFRFWFQMNLKNNFSVTLSYIILNLYLILNSGINLVLKPRTRFNTGLNPKDKLTQCIQQEQNLCF